MAHPFFDKGIQSLVDLVRPGMLCAFDFDGTLAPIVADPSSARISSSMLRRLAALTEFTPVAVITGRSVEDVSLLLDFFPEYVIGNHGIEGIPGGEMLAERYRQTCRIWLERLQAALQAQEFEPTIWVEDKTFSLSVHYRMAHDPAVAEERVRQLIQRQLPDAQIVEGKRVFNLLPKEAPDKGKALAMLCDTISAPCALYIGDDVTDESVFKLQRPNLLSIRVENSADTAAEFYLHNQEELVRFLDMLLHRLSEVLLAKAAARDAP